jgi:hypothetical protein
LRNYPNGTFDKILGPQIDQIKKKPVYKHAVLDLDGIVHPGSRVLPKQVSFFQRFSIITYSVVILVKLGKGVGLFSKFFIFPENQKVTKGEFSIDSPSGAKKKGRREE